MTLQVNQTIEPKRKPAQKPAQKTKEAKPNSIYAQAKEPSTGKLVVNRAGAIVMTPITGVAGVLTIAGSFVNGLLNPNTTVDKSMTKGIQAAGQGADMLDKMWQGRYF